MEELERYRKVGGVGWQYIGDQIFHSKDISHKLETISKKLEEYQESMKIHRLRAKVKAHKEGKKNKPSSLARSLKKNVIKAMKLSGAVAAMDVRKASDSAKKEKDRIHIGSPIKDRVSPKMANWDKV